MTDELDAKIKLRLLLAESLLSDFEDEDPGVRLHRAIVTLFLASGEKDAAGRHRLDMDAALAALAVATTTFLRAVRGPNVTVDFHVTDGKRRGVVLGAPPPVQNLH